MPAADGTDPDNRFAFADLRSIAIFSTTRHPDAAARFVAYLTSPAADRLLIEEASQLPYRRGLASDPRFAASLERWPTLATYATYVERARDIDVDPDVVEIFDLLSEAYEEAADVRQRPGAAGTGTGGRRSEEHRECALSSGPGRCSRHRTPPFCSLFAAYPIVFALVLVFLQWDLVTAPILRGIRQRAAARRTMGASGARSGTRSSSSASTFHSRS